MKDKKLSRREREKLRHRSEMLAAALTLFSEKGYYNVSMHEIAARAEFAVGTLYKFFKNKEDLYKALVSEKSEQYHKALKRVLDGPGDEIEKLRNYIRTKGERFRDNLPMVRLYLAENRGASFNIKAGMDDELRKRYNIFLMRLASVIESGVKNKRFKKIADSYHVAVAIESTVNSFLLLWLDAPDEHPYPDDPDTILNIFFNGLIAK